MSRRLKLSRYNFLTPSDDGRMVAYNAVSSGMVLLDADTLREYQTIAAGGDPESVRPKTVTDLREGHFLIPENLDEIQELKVTNARARFGGTAAGLTIVPTLSCNFGCSYCYEPLTTASGRRPPHRILDESLDDAILNLATALVTTDGSFHVTWYGGEPLLALRRIETLSRKLMGRCDERKVRYAAGMVTNGYLLTPEVVQRLLDVKVNFLQLTMDGPRAVHDQRRPLAGGGPTYDVILANLLAIADSVPIGISLRINADVRNKDSVSELLHELRAHGLHARKRLHVNIAMVHALTPSCQDAVFCMPLAEFSQLEAGFYRTALDLGFQVARYPMPLPGVCGAISVKSLLITPDGEVHKCWSTVGQSDLAVGRLSPDGYTPDRGAENRWLSYSPFHEQCLDCDILPLCMGGCPYRQLCADRMAAVESPCSSLKLNMTDTIQIHAKARMRMKAEAAAARNSCPAPKATVDM
jgi:uncharacterized protein